MLWDTMDKDYCGILVLDPHDEYYGRNALGLKDHPSKNITYYTSNNPPAGTKSLKINIKLIKPGHFNGVADFSDPQKQLMLMYYKYFGSKWVESIILEKKLEAFFKTETLAVVKRRLLYLLNLEFKQNQLKCNGIFDLQAGESTLSDICSELENSKTVVIDTSNFPSAIEILIGSLIVNDIFDHYKKYNVTGELKDKPVISIVLEEAPRVLGREVLEKGSNIFATIAREGRKFQVGLTAITQLPSLIPRQILANMNTKIILGIEMKPERIAIIESASQDLSEDDRNIASLDKGEAIITSNFTKFATPIAIPFFNKIVEEQKESAPKKDFSGVDLA
jgi:DNA helicase HerA-like ATPase